MDTQFLFSLFFCSRNENVLLRKVSIENMSEFRVEIADNEEISGKRRHEGLLSKLCDSKKSKTLFTMDWIKSKFTGKSQKKVLRKNSIDSQVRQSYSQIAFDNDFNAATLPSDVAVCDFDDDEDDQWLGHDLHSLSSFEAQASFGETTPTTNQKAKDLMHAICSQEINQIFADRYTRRTATRRSRLEHVETMTSQDLNTSDSEQFYLELQSEPETSNQSLELPVNQSGIRATTFNQSGLRDQEVYEPIYMENIVISDQLFQDPEAEGPIYMQNIVISEDLFQEREARAISFNQPGQRAQVVSEPIYMENIVISDDLFMDPEAGGPIYMQNIVMDDRLFMSPSRLYNTPPNGQMVDQEDIYGVYNVVSAASSNPRYGRPAVDNYGSNSSAAGDICGSNYDNEDIYEQIYFEVKRSSTPNKE